MNKISKEEAFDPIAEHNLKAQKIEMEIKTKVIEILIKNLTEAVKLLKGNI